MYKGVDETKMTFRNVTTEVVEEAKVEKDESVEKVLEKYTTTKRDFNKFKSIELDLPFLTPAQINFFFQIVVKNLDCSVFYDNQIRSLNKFLNRLISDSWNNGYNNFKLDNPTGKKIPFLFAGLSGEIDNPISITFHGNGREVFALCSTYCIYDLHGDFEFGFSKSSDNCIYNIYGEIDTQLSDYHSNIYNFFKKVKSLGNRKQKKISDCTFNIYEGIDEIIWEPISNCTFRTPDSKTYDQIVSSFREYKNNDNSFKEWYEKRRDSFKEDDNLLEDIMFQGYNKREGDSTTYNNIQLMKPK